MYPEGFHPIQRDLLPDYSRIVKPLPRSEAVPKYYYTSFDVSILISSDTVEVDPTESRAAPLPELAAFKVDISAMGTLIEKEFFEVRDDKFSHWVGFLQRHCRGSQILNFFGRLSIRW